MESQSPVGLAVWVTDWRQECEFLLENWDWESWPFKNPPRLAPSPGWTGALLQQELPALHQLAGTSRAEPLCCNTAQLFFLHRASLLQTNVIFKENSNMQPLSCPPRYRFLSIVKKSRT